MTASELSLSVVKSLEQARLWWDALVWSPVRRASRAGAACCCLMGPEAVQAWVMWHLCCCLLP